MKYLYLFSVLLLTTCTTMRDEVNFQSPDYHILISEKADILTRRAAAEIQAYFSKINHKKLKIVNENTAGGMSIIIGKEMLEDFEVSAALDTIKEDGFVIKTTDKGIVVCGNTGKANLYAAYTFIEEFLGCRLLSPTAEFTPDIPNIKIPNITKIYEPAFSYRRILFPGRKSEKYRYWHKVEELDDWGMFVHTFDDLVPPEKYYDEHPEYFSLISGRRFKDAQLCLSNPDLIQTLKDNLGAEMAKAPDKKYWSVSQNDCYNYCECDGCKAMYDQYGSISGAYIHMANQLAAEFPDKTISTLAYQFTRSAPTRITPRKNVNIMFCSIECNRSMPLEADKRSADFVQDLKDWSRLTQNIFLWDYVVQFKNYLTPFPNFHVLQPNIRLFEKYGVDMMFEQGSGGSWSDLSVLKQYLIAKLLWNPRADVDLIVDDFMKKYYGAAAPYIKSYYELTHRSLQAKQEAERLDIYGYPMDYTDSYLTPDLLKQYRELMDKAERSVEGDSIYYERVLRVRLAVDFAYLDIALNANPEDMPFVVKSGDSTVINPEMLEYLNRFVAISQQTGTTAINERNFHTPDYQQYVLHKLKRATRPNIAKDKSLKLLTTPSKKYPVGGVKALTDGLFGDLDYHNNWLGFEGEDMLVEIDLQQQETFSGLSMNFLKAVNSWVFLPEEVRVEVSDDGINYRMVVNVKGDNSDRNYLVKSIPFDIEFEAVKARFIRLKAISMKQCPEWHRGYGKPSWIFIDELVVE